MKIDTTKINLSISDLEKLAQLYVQKEMKDFNIETDINPVNINKLIRHMFEMRNMEIIDYEEDEHRMFRMSAFFIAEKMRRATKDLTRTATHIHNIQNQIRLLFARQFGIKIKDEHTLIGKYLEL